MGTGGTRIVTDRPHIYEPQFFSPSQTKPDECALQEIWHKAWLGLPRQAILRKSLLNNLQWGQADGSMKQDTFTLGAHIPGSYILNNSSLSEHCSLS